MQRLLNGSSDFSWRAVSCLLLHSYTGLGLDKALYLMDPLKLDTSMLPIFYKNIFKVWSLFVVQGSEDSHSLYWLLGEPLIYGSRLDLTDSSLFPGFSRLLIKHNVSTLSQLLNVVGLDFKNEVALAQHLGIRSIRLVTQLLMKWQAALRTTEMDLLTEYFVGSSVSNPKD